MVLGTRRAAALALEHDRTSQTDRGFHWLAPLPVPDGLVSWVCRKVPFSVTESIPQCGLGRAPSVCSVAVWLARGAVGKGLAPQILAKLIAGGARPRGRTIRMRAPLCLWASFLTSLAGSVACSPGWGACRSLSRTRHPLVMALRLRGGQGVPAHSHPVEGEGVGGVGEEGWAGSMMGRKEYWNEVYERELSNFHEFGDAGEEWFEDSGCAGRVSEWLATHDFEGVVRKPLSEAEVLDVGTGNGMMLEYLIDVGFRRVMATDYLEAAVRLATLNLERMRQSACWAADPDIRSARVELLVDDFLDTSLGKGAFDVLHDKGTLDAVSLSGRVDSARAYVASAAWVVRPGGLCVITSCNYTQEELRRLMEEEGAFVSTGSLPYEQISFGGSVGSRVVTEAFRRAGNA